MQLTLFKRILPTFLDESLRNAKEDIREN